MGDVAVGAVVKLAVRRNVKEEAEKLPPVILTSRPSLLGSVRSPRLEMPDVSRNALFKALKLVVPAEASVPPSTRKPAPPSAPPLMTPPAGSSNVPAFTVVAPV